MLSNPNELRQSWKKRTQKAISKNPKWDKYSNSETNNLNKCHRLLGRQNDSREGELWMMREGSHEELGVEKGLSSLLFLCNEPF